MYYADPETEVRVTRSTRTTNKKKAIEAAAVWQDELNNGRYQAGSRLTWETFRMRYEEEHLAGLAQSTRESAASALNHVERVMNPARLVTVTSQFLSRFQAELRKEGMKETTLACHLRHIRAALSWAVSQDMLFKVPTIKRPKRAKGFHKIMRGRPLDLEEFKRMLRTTGKVEPRNARAWRRYLVGLWLSGLRLEESLKLSWAEEASFKVDLSGRHPRFRIYAEAEKGHQDRLLPMTPDFVRFLFRTPEAERIGPVFNLVRPGTQVPMSPKNVIRIISGIGERAGVVVNQKEEKFATAHDLRRSFGSRWARRVMPAVLQRLMRHASIETTMKYYVDLEADELADGLWDDYGEGRTENARTCAAPDPYGGKANPQEAGRAKRHNLNGRCRL